MTRKMYGALSGLPAIPNIVFGPIGGMLVDWIGAGRYVGAPSVGKKPKVQERRRRPTTNQPHR